MQNDMLFFETNQDCNDRYLSQRVDKYTASDQHEKYINKHMQKSIVHVQELSETITLQDNMSNPAERENSMSEYIYIYIYIQQTLRSFRQELKVRINEFKGQRKIMQCKL